MKIIFIMFVLLLASVTKASKEGQPDMEYEVPAEFSFDDAASETGSMNVSMIDPDMFQDNDEINAVRQTLEEYSLVQSQFVHTQANNGVQTSNSSFNQALQNTEELNTDLATEEVIVPIVISGYEIKNPAHLQIEDILELLEPAFGCLFYGSELDQLNISNIMNQLDEISHTAWEVCRLKVIKHLQESTIPYLESTLERAKKDLQESKEKNLKIKKLKIKCKKHRYKKHKYKLNKHDAVKKAKYIKYKMKYKKYVQMVDQLSPYDCISDRLDDISYFENDIQGKLELITVLTMAEFKMAYLNKTDTKKYVFEVELVKQTETETLFFCAYEGLSFYGPFSDVNCSEKIYFQISD